MAFLRIISIIFSVLVALAFLGAGANKLTDQIDANLHGMLAQNFHTYIKLWPIPNLTADQFRLLVGAAEVILALGLFVSSLAALPLFFIGIGAVLTHIRLDENDKAITPAVLTGMLLVILIHRFTARHEQPSKTKKQ